MVTFINIIILRSRCFSSVNYFRLSNLHISSIIFTFISDYIGNLCLENLDYIIMLFGKRSFTFIKWDVSFSLNTYPSIVWEVLFISRRHPFIYKKILHNMMSYFFLSWLIIPLYFEEIHSCIDIYLIYESFCKSLFDCVLYMF